MYLDFRFKENCHDNDYIWRPPNLSELTPIIFNMELIHFGSVSSHMKKYHIINNEFAFPIIFINLHDKTNISICSTVNYVKKLHMNYLHNILSITWLFLQ